MGDGTPDVALESAPPSSPARLLPLLTLLVSLFAFSLFPGSALGTALLGRLLATRGFDAVLLTSGAALVALAVRAPRLTALPAARAG